MTRHGLCAALAAVFLIGLPLGGVNAATGVTATETLKVGDPYNGPTIVFSSAPEVAAIPGTRIRYLRNSDYDMFRSGGRWYYRYDGCWYQAASHNGPFKYVKDSAVPRGVRSVSARPRRDWANAAQEASRVKSRHTSRTVRYGR